MVGSGDQSCILPCCNCGDFHDLWWVLVSSDVFLHCCNCGDFHDLWWVLVNSDVFCIVVIVVILIICGGFR